MEVKDRWVKVTATLDIGAARHGMTERMFPRLKLKRKTSPKKFVAENGEQIRDLGEKTSPFKTRVAGTVGGQTAFDKLVRPATLCGGEKSENVKIGSEVEGTEFAPITTSQNKRERISREGRPLPWITTS